MRRRPKVMACAAAGKKTFVVHPRYGYETTGLYPKKTWLFHVGESGNWLVRDRGNAPSLETNLLAVSSTKPFRLCIGDDAVFASSADGDLHRVSFERTGLLLTRITAPITFKGLAHTDMVQARAEVFPAHLRDEGAHLFAYEGRCFLYKNGTVAARDALPSGIKSWPECLPVVTNETKTDLALWADLPAEWTTGQIAAALVEKDDKPHAYFELDAKTQTYVAAGTPYFTVHPDTGVFRTTNQGVKYADTRQIPANARTSIEITGILRQVQCASRFSLFTGPDCAAVLQSCNVGGKYSASEHDIVGGVYVVDCPSGLPATKLSPCVIVVHPRTWDCEDGIPADARTHAVTFVCESIGAAGSDRVRDLESLVVRTVSRPHVFVTPVDAAASRRTCAEPGSPPAAPSSNRTCAELASPPTTVREPDMALVPGHALVHL